MKISNIQKRLYNLNASNLKISIERTNWGWFVRMTARLNRGYYDIEVTEQISDKNHVMSEHQITVSFLASETSTICGKPYHDESDMMTDYCAWNFYTRLNDLNKLQDRVLA